VPFEFWPCAYISDSVLSPFNGLWLSYLHIKFEEAGVKYTRVYLLLDGGEITRDGGG